VTCSVITPTWQRHDLLLSRCIPSVAAQTYPRVEHVVVSDGRDLELAGKLLQPGQAPSGYFADHPLRTSFRFTMLPEHDPAARWGHWARLHGTDVAKGEYITYLDDDDAYRPEHCRLLAAALDENPGAGFAYARTIMHAQGGAYCRIGTDPPQYGQITVTLMHRRALLDVATWEQSEPTIDWDLVSRWLDAGVNYTSVGADTADIWPSTYR
jgi:glycosyltransferase involved in cell wall biosynthesis